MLAALRHLPGRLAATVARFPAALGSLFGFGRPGRHHAPRALPPDADAPTAPVTRPQQRHVAPITHRRATRTRDRASRRPPRRMRTGPRG